MNEMSLPKALTVAKEELVCDAFVSNIFHPRNLLESPKNIPKYPTSIQEELY